MIRSATISPASSSAAARRPASASSAVSATCWARSCSLRRRRSSRALSRLLGLAALDCQLALKLRAAHGQRPLPGGGPPLARSATRCVAGCSPASALRRSASRSAASARSRASSAARTPFNAYSTTPRATRSALAATSAAARRRVPSSRSAIARSTPSTITWRTSCQVVDHTLPSRACSTSSSARSRARRAASSSPSSWASCARSALEGLLELGDLALHLPLKARARSRRALPRALDAGLPRRPRQSDRRARPDPARAPRASPRAPCSSSSP